MEQEDKLKRLEADFRNKGSQKEKEMASSGRNTFSEDIMLNKVSRNSKNPDIDLYDGTTDS
ncbi:hypothetical protein AHAS_Ahas06G0188900 [Arachis hypogaea]